MYPYPKRNLSIHHRTLIPILLRDLNMFTRWLPYSHMVARIEQTALGEAFHTHRPTSTFGE